MYHVHIVNKHNRAHVVLQLNAETVSIYTCIRIYSVMRQLCLSRIRYSRGLAAGSHLLCCKRPLPISLKIMNMFYISTRVRRVLIPVCPGRSCGWGPLPCCVLHGSIFKYVIHIITKGHVRVSVLIELNV